MQATYKKPKQGRTKSSAGPHAVRGLDIATLVNITEK